MFQVVSFLTFRFHVTKRRQHKMLALSGPETLTYYWRMLHQLAGFRTIDTSTESDSEPDNTLPPVGKKFNHLKKKSYLLSFCKFKLSGL